jgi:hypothetical protein
MTPGKILFVGEAVLEGEQRGLFVEEGRKQLFE